jgi:hypothetical protein
MDQNSAPAYLVTVESEMSLPLYSVCENCRYSEKKQWLQSLFASDYNTIMNVCATIHTI